MPDDEGLALHDAARRGGRARPAARDRHVLRQVGGVSRRARRAPAGTVLFTVDHHRGSEENQAGWEHHDTEVVDPRDRPDGHAAVLPPHDPGRRTSKTSSSAIVGHSIPVARVWQTPLGFLFIDGGHAEDVAMADYGTGRRTSIPGGTLAIHDVFEDPADGRPSAVPRVAAAVADGFEPVSTTGSLRVLTNATEVTNATSSAAAPALSSTRRLTPVRGRHVSFGGSSFAAPAARSSVERLDVADVARVEQLGQHVAVETAPQAVAGAGLGAHDVADLEAVDPAVAETASHLDHVS